MTTTAPASPSPLALVDGELPVNGAAPRFGNVVPGRTVAPEGPWIDVVDPVTGTCVGRVPDSGPDEVDAAVQAAAGALAEWSAVTPAMRGRLMMRVRDLVARHEDRLARLLTLENGKPHAEALAELDRALEMLEFAAAIPLHLKGETMLEVGRNVDMSTYTLPVGVVAGITPFNFPAMVPMWMVPVALAAGNTFVLKPSEQTPLSAIALSELFEEAGLPAGAFNVLHGGRAAAERLIRHPDVAAVSFVGSAPAAKNVYATAAAEGKRVQALGGAKNHLVVLDDADLDLTVSAIWASSFASAGQRCLAGSVLLATEGIIDALTDALAAKARQVAEAPASDSEFVPPLINDGATARVCTAVDGAVAAGARLIVGSGAPAEDGRVLPVLLRCDDPDQAVFHQELFGPVLTVGLVRDLDHALAWLNASEFGNAASIFTRDGASAQRFRKTAEAGMIGINAGVPAPSGFISFSGWKGSFYGDLHVNGSDGVRFYTRRKAVIERWPSPAGAPVAEQA